MKKLFLAVLTSVASISFVACDNSKLKSTEIENQQLKEDLAESLATRDSMYALINDIAAGMNQIKELEKIISTPSSLQGDTQSRKEQIKNDIIAIQNALQSRRERLDQLEARLKSTDSEMAKTIRNLKAQIAEQQTEIASLTNKLAAANIQIEELETTVSGLNRTVDTLATNVANERKERQEAEQQATELANELNTCYYAIGTKAELKKAKIIETGFLRKTKILKSDYEQSYFTTADKRTLKKIQLHSKKAKVMTNQPASSYNIEDENGQKVLTITDPDAFWNLSNYLVVEVD